MRPTWRTAALGILVITAGIGSRPSSIAAQGDDQPPMPGPILRFDARLDALLPSDATVEVVVSGGQWLEGPVWDRRDGSLLYSDVPANRVLRWKEGLGVTVAYERSGYSGRDPFTGREPGSNGLSFDPAGRLTLSEHGNRRLTLIRGDGEKVALADRYQGRRLNSPNDNVWTPDGDLLFTDPPYGLPRGHADPAGELGFSGVYRLRSDGTLMLLTDELRGPNGIALTPDGRNLIVSNSDPARPVWMRYPIRDDGGLGPGTVLYDASWWAGRAPGLPDGLKVDRAGNLFAAGPGGVYVIAADGTLLGIIQTGVATGNVAWGDDGSVLYIAAGTEIRRVRTTTRGW